MNTSELGKLIRFAVIGTTCAGIYFSVFVVQSALGVTPFLANLIAFTLAVVVQYLGHTLWTFRGSLKDAIQGVRFVATIGLGLLISTVISSVIAPHFTWPAWLTATLVVILLPISNYVAFRFWVYRAESTIEDRQ